MKEFEEKQSKMSDKELISRAEVEINELCRTGCKTFLMSVPPKITDSDMIISELIRRFKNNIN